MDLHVLFCTDNSKMKREVPETQPILESKEQKGSMRVLLTGILAILAVYIANIAGITCVQLMAQLPPDFELNALRFSVGVVIAIIYLLGKRTTPTLSKSKIEFVLALAATQAIYNVFLYSHHLQQIPIVTILSVYQAFKIIFVLILSKIFLSSEIPCIKVLICVISFAGTSLTVLPKIIEYMHNGWEPIPKDHDKVFNTTNLFKQRINGTVFKYDYPVLNPTKGLTPNLISCNNSVSRVVCDCSDFNTSDVTDSPDTIHHVKEVVTLETFLFGVCFPIPSSLSSAAQNVLITGTYLKETNFVVFSLWYGTIVTAFSFTMMFAFEHPIIPDNLTDILLFFGHACSAASGIYLEVLICQNIDVNVFAVMATVRLPLAFLAQKKILKSVTHVEHLWMFITGILTIVISAIIMPLYECILIRRKINDST